MFGALRFFEAGRAAGIKPIIGVEAYVAPGSRFDRNPGENEEKYHHLTLLAENETGYRNLLKLVSPPTSRASTTGRAWTSSCSPSTARASSASRDACRPSCRRCCSPVSVERAPRRRRELPRHLRSRPVLHGAAGSRPRRTSGAIIAEADRARARSLGVPLVATNDLHYTVREDAKPHDVLLCIQQQKLQSDPKRLRFDAEEFYLKSAAGDATRLPRAPRGVRQDAADRGAGRARPGVRRIRVDRRDRYHLPRFETPEGKALEVYLRELVYGARPSATATRSPTTSRERIDARARRHHADGVRGLLPDRVGPDPVRARERDPRGAGPRLGGRLGRVVLPADHRPRPAPLRAAVRAVPEPRRGSRCRTSTWTSTSAGATR